MCPDCHAGTCEVELEANLKDRPDCHTGIYDTELGVDLGEGRGSLGF